MSGSDTTPALLLRGLGKDYPAGWRGATVRAVGQLDLRIERGQIYGLLGPNGSGKSTTLKLILGLQSPTRGACEILGEPWAHAAARRRIGYLPESPGFYRHLTGEEAMEFFGRLSGLNGATLGSRVTAALALVGLADVAGRRIGAYSRGMLQRLGLAQALVHDPELLVLDEPTTGVDPAGVAQMAELLRRLKAQGKTVLLTSHLLAEVAAICDRIAILDRGRLVAEGRLAELLADGAGRALVVRGLSEGDECELRQWLETRGGVLESNGATPSLQRFFLEKTKRN